MLEELKEKVFRANLDLVKHAREVQFESKDEWSSNRRV